MLRLTALGKSFAGTSEGIKACRAGVSKAHAAEAIDVSKKIGHACANPENVTSASAALQTSIDVCVTIINRRRSTTSATTPPIKEHRIIGNARHAPTRPRARAEWVIT